MNKIGTDVRARLLRRGVPKADENLSGYIIRLTELNGYETPSWITMLGEAGNRSSKWKRAGQNGLSRGSPMFYEASYYNGLARLTGTATEALHRTAYPAAPPARRGSARYWVFNEAVSRTLIGIKPKICPDCLAEENYCRKVWDLTAVVACPIHHRMLITRCPACHREIRWHRAEISRCHHCGADWRAATKQGRMPDQELKYVREIYRRCGLAAGISTSIMDRSPLCELSLEDYISLLFFFASQFTGLNEVTGRYLIKEGSEKLHILMVRAFSVFDDFPHKYHEFLEWRRTVPRELPECKRKCKTGLYKEFGHFWDALYKVFAESQFAFLRDEFEQYLREQWDGGYISTYSRLNKSIRLSDDRKYLTRGRAVRLLKTHLGWLDRFTEEGRIKVKVMGTPHKRIMLYDAGDVKRIRAEFDGSLGLRTTARKLGIGLKPLKELVEYDCITALRGREIDGYSKWRFSRTAVDELIEKLSAAVEEIPARRIRRINLHRAVRCAGRTSIKLAAFIRSVLDGELRPCGWAMRKGLYGLQFTKADVLAYIQYGYWKDNARQLTVKGAARKLHMRPDVLKFLVEKGFIKAEANATNRMAKLGARAINVSELERFVATYVPTVHLARDLKSTSQRVLKTLRTKNIFPVTGKGVDGGLLYLVRRSDLAAVDLKELLAQV